VAGVSGAGLSRFRDGLSLSGAQLKKLDALLAACADVGAMPPEGALCRPFYRHGREIVLQAILLTAARDGRDPGATMKTAASMEAPRFPVGGADLIALGIPPGKRLGAILTALEEEWLSRDCKPEKQELLTRLKTLT